MDYTTFKQQVYNLTTIDLNAYKENQMKRRIDALIKKSKCQGYQDYVALLKSSPKDLEEFTTYLTINVSEFFRNPTQWDILQSEIIPTLMKKKGNIKIWSAACSTGDEPYSLAMTLSKFFPLRDIQILATDLDKDILAKAKLGEYDSKHIANMPMEFKQKYFIQQEDKYIISPDIKKCITFKQHNLLKDSYPTNMDLIVCRNVLIYFTEEAKEDIYRKLSQSLVTGGILFVGSTEQIIGAQKYGFNPYRIFFYEKA